MRKIGLFVIQFLCFIVAANLGFILLVSTSCCLVLCAIIAGWNTSDEAAAWAQNILLGGKK